MNKQTVLISGASRGIGAAIAKELAALKKYRFILLCHRNASALEQVIASMRKIDPACEIFSCQIDLSDAISIEKSFQNICDLFGAPDILINNAGIAHIGLLQDMTLAEVNTLVQTDLMAAIHLSRLCIPFMLHRTHNEAAFRQAGSDSPDRFSAPCGILNISSVWGNCGAACEAVYSAAKGGINSFTKALAKELAPSKIPVNALACGMVDTDMNACLNEEDRQGICDQIPAGRIVSPEEIACMVALLLQSPAYLTGQIITMDGGWI